MQSTLHCALENLLGSTVRVRMLRILVHKGEATLTSLMNEVHTNHRTIVQHLKVLQDNNIVEENKFGRIRVIRYKIENIKARKLRDLIVTLEEDTGEDNDGI